MHDKKLRPYGRLSWKLSSLSVELLFAGSLGVWVVMAALPAWAGQGEASSPAPALPETPAPQRPVETQHPNHAGIHYTSNGTPCLSEPDCAAGAVPTGQTDQFAPCPHHKIPQTSERFVSGTQAQHLTVKDKARMAERDLVDPYDAMTVVGDSGVSVAADAHSPYGPGIKGFGYDTGVSLGQDASSEVTNTFLIPAVTHQDPQYHREPDASKMHRVEHAIVQVGWTESDSGKGMPNYSNIVGDAADDEASDFYVPGEKRSLGATAERYGVGLALRPTDNLITEFAPDVASHVHVKSIFWQNIVDKLAGVATNSTVVAAGRPHGGAPQAKHAARRH